MLDAATLQEVERKLINIRTLRSVGESFARYRANDLPTAMDEHRLALVDQGYDAGYRAACEELRIQLGELKSEALRAKR